MKTFKDLVLNLSDNYNLRDAKDIVLYYGKTLSHITIYKISIEPYTHITSYITKERLETAMKIIKDNEYKDYGVNIKYEANAYKEAIEVIGQRISAQRFYIELANHFNFL